MHLTVNSLNSLAEILREAKPLYAECHSIINDLPKGGGASQAPRPSTMQTRIKETTHRSQPGNGNQFYASRSKGLPTPESDGQGSVNPAIEARNSKPGIVGLQTSTKAHSVSETSITVQRAELSGNTLIVHIVGGDAGGARRFNGAQPEDGADDETTGMTPDDTIAAANRPESVLRLAEGIKIPASEPPTQPHRAGTSRAPKPRTIPGCGKPLSASPVLLARYDRGDLYKKVWTLPMQQVAKEYGVSDVAIGKTCRKLQIPVPGTGYWAKKAANRPVELRPPLPELPAGTKTCPNVG